MTFKKIFGYLAGGVLCAGFFSCEDLVDPAEENLRDLDQIKTEAASVHGFLVDAYSTLPGYYDNSECATDDAVSNDPTNSYLKMATGSWTSSTSPFNGYWSRSYAAIQYINLFLQNMEGQRYVKNDDVNALLQRRYEGEAYALRGIHLYYLLRTYAGKASDGQLAGVQILNEFLDADGNFDIPRSTFSACVKAALDDFDKASELLPMEYNDLPEKATKDDIPEKFQGMVEDPALYNRAMGNVARQLVNGVIVDAFRSKLLLLAASPAFNEGATWEDAANAAAKVIDYAGGITALDPKGLTYYNNIDEIKNLKEGSNPAEIIWRGNYRDERDEESNNFPPSLFGNGRINPTQNFVDAFPMKNGYPITDEANSNYDKSNPYNDRDPRLDLYVIHDGSLAGASNAVINTARNSGTDDAIDKIEKRSTRTGYYMKKRLRMDVKCDPSAAQSQRHYTPRLRMTEIFLNYAEAANEAWGPNAGGNNSYSAYDVIKAIRQRAGKADKEKMRELIRNERRIELCFESFRFWDLRRWNCDLNETAYGVEGEVEKRAYSDYMIYAPIPYSETMKFANLKQNQGWQ